MEKQQPSSVNPYISLMKTAWHYAYQEKRRYLLVYALFIGSNIMVALEPVIWGMYINELQLQGPNIMQATLFYAGAFIMIRWMDWSFHGPARIMERELAFNVSRNFLQELYHKALHLPVKWHQDHHSGETINRIRKAYEALKNFFERGFAYIHTIAKFLFSFAAMIYFAPLFGLIAIVFGVFIVMIILRFDKPFIKGLKEVNEREHVVSSTLFDSLSNIITVITLRLEKRMQGGLMEKVNHIFAPFRRTAVINEWKWFVVDSCIALTYCTILIGYLYQNWTPGETFLIGSLVTLMAYVGRFTSVFHNLAYQYTDIVRYNTDVLTAQSIIDAYEEQHLPETDELIQANWKEIKISNLNFSHRETTETGEAITGLDKLHLRIARGQKVALIGESGSGKSTLLALLRGLYEAESGVLMEVDGQSFDKLDLIAGEVTLFPQDPEIFENTIEYNITLGLPFSKAEVEEVCEVAHFSEVVHQLPEGLESSIREKGVNLSGGQKQRLALARGVLAARDSRIILLDEPTSSVDPKTELRIYRRMFRKFTDKAVVSALHRLHLLRLFDYIYVLDKGKVVDEGSFDALRQNSLVFQELWRHQEEKVVDR